MASFVWAALLLVGMARAEAASSTPEDNQTEQPVEAQAEIVVYGDLVVARRRGELNQSIRDLGYTAGRRRNGRTVYSNEIAWRPDIVVDDDGFYTVKRAAVRLDWPDLPGYWGRPPVGALICVVNPTACIKVGGQVVSPARLNAAKRQVHEGIAEEAARWQEAIAGRAMRERLDHEIPDLLSAIWDDGVAPGGQPLESREARRAALLDFWATRTDYPEGRLARDMAAIFLEMEVQTSAWPVTDNEQVAANERCRCTPRLAIVNEPELLDNPPSSP